MMNNIKNIFIIILIILLSISFFSKNNQTITEKEEIEIIPESNGSSGIVKVKDSIIYEEVLIPYPVPGKDKIVVDKKYKDLYDKALIENDSLKTYALYLEAIKINEFKERVVDNDTVNIDLYTKYRGELIEYKVDYKVKERLFSYKPEIKTSHPKLSLVFGGGIGAPYKLDSGLRFKGDIGAQFKNGDIYTISLDNELYILLEYKKTLKLIK